MCVHASEWLKLLDVVQVILTDEIFLFQISRKQRTDYELPLNRVYNTTFSSKGMEVRSSFFSVRWQYNTSTAVQISDSSH